MSRVCVTFSTSNGPVMLTLDGEPKAEDVPYLQELAELIGAGGFGVVTPEQAAKQEAAMERIRARNSRLQGER